MPAQATARIPLKTKDGTVRAYTVVDQDDYAEVAQFTWHVDSNGYARGYLGIVDGQKRYAQMHRYLLNAPAGLQVDHMNHDTLDNRRENLRLVPQYGNAQNRAKRHGTSKYRGVYWNKGLKRWIAQCRVNNKTVYIGSYTNEDDAGLAAREWRAARMPYSIEALGAEESTVKLTEQQEHRKIKMSRAGDTIDVFEVPAGAVLMVRRDSTFKPNWFEIVEPEPRCLQCWDISDW